MARTRKPAHSSDRKPKTSHTTKAPKNDGGGLLSPEKLQKLYTAMLHSRLIEEEVCRLAKEGKVPGPHGVSCQEATEIGAIMSLEPQDCVAPRARNRGDGVGIDAGFGFGFNLGLSLKEVFAQLLGLGAANVTAGRPQLPANVQGPLVLRGAAALAARLNISTGIAFAHKNQAHKNQKKSGVVLAFSGGDSTALASWREAVDFATTHKLPIVHVVQDDLGSESSNAASGGASSGGASLGPASEGTAPQGGIPTLVVDGNDVVAVYRVAQEAIRRARQGHGPTLIACKNHRWPGYSGLVPATPAHASGLEKAASQDPIENMESYLEQKNLWSDAWKQKLVKAFKKQIQTAIESAERELAKKAKAAV